MFENFTAKKAAKSPPFGGGFFEASVLSRTGFLDGGPASRVNFFSVRGRSAPLKRVEVSTDALRKTTPPEPRRSPVIDFQDTGRATIISAEKTLRTQHTKSQVERQEWPKKSECALVHCFAMTRRVAGVLVKAFRFRHLRSIALSSAQCIDAHLEIFTRSLSPKTGARNPKSENSRIKKQKLEI